MQKIPLELAQPNMLLGRSITSLDGGVLAAEGQMLTESVLRRLNMAGITSLVVQGKPLPGYGMGYNVKLRQERLSFLFRNHKDNIFMKTVCAFLSKHLQERL